MATLRIYLKKDKAKFRSKDGEHTYKGFGVEGFDTTEPYINIYSFHPLNLAYEGSIVNMMNTINHEDILRITAEVRSDWVKDRFNKDGEVFTHGSARCVVSSRVHMGGKYGPELSVSLEVVGQNLSSVVCLIHKMKNGTVHSQEQVISQLRAENGRLRYNLVQIEKKLSVIEQLTKDAAAEYEKEVASYKGKIEGLEEQLDLQTQALANCKHERDANGNYLNDLVVYLKLPFWKRWITKKPSVFEKFKI